MSAKTVDMAVERLLDLFVMGVDGSDAAEVMVLRDGYPTAICMAANERVEKMRVDSPDELKRMISEARARMRMGDK